MSSCQYADDTTLVLGNAQSIKESLKIIKDFSIVSGLKLNIEKSTGLWVRSLKGSPEMYEKINFTNKPFRCLGLYLSTDLNEGISKTWEEQLKNFKMY